MSGYSMYSSDEDDNEHSAYAHERYNSRSERSRRPVADPTTNRESRPTRVIQYSGQQASGGTQINGAVGKYTVNNNHTSPSPYVQQAMSVRQSYLPPEPPAGVVEPQHRVSAAERRERYTVAWICALPVPEWKASQLMFDEIHEDIPLPHNARSQYVFGTINNHDVVMGCLPVEQIGETSAAAVLSEMIAFFPGLRFALLVGVGGGVWSEEGDVRLGDVVVGQPSRAARHGGVLRYDYGKAVQGKENIQLMGMLPPPQPLVLATLGKLQAGEGYGLFDKNMAHFAQYRDSRTGKALYERPNTSDRLFQASYVHSNSKLACQKVPCDVKYEVQREPRYRPDQSLIHYGLIASGDQVMKDAILRDKIVDQLDGDVLCFEMEAGGMVGQLSCLVIRGICDYCDSHKNKVWQPYAAAAAASWAKEFLRNMSPVEARNSEHISSERILYL